MKNYLWLCLAVFLLSAEAKAQLYQDDSGKWLNQYGGNIYGDSRINPDADPRINPYADPRINPDADPRINPDADPRINPYADPRISPFGDPNYKCTYSLYNCD